MPAHPVRETEAGTGIYVETELKGPEEQAGPKAGTPGYTASLHFHPMLDLLGVLSEPCLPHSLRLALIGTSQLLMLWSPTLPPSPLPGPTPTRLAG